MKAPRRYPFSAGNLDLAALLLPFILMGGLLLWLPGSMWLKPLGLFSAFFAPGYALLAALYPTREGLNLVQRLAGSLGLSAVCDSLLFLLVSLTIGINLPAVFFILADWTAILTLIAFYRRRKQPAAERFQMRWPALRGAARPGAAILIAALLAICGFAGLRLVRASMLAQPQFTEFYLLDEAGQITGYTRQVQPGDPPNITIGIDNHSENLQHYRLTYQINETGETSFAETPLREMDIKPGELWLIKPMVNTLEQPGLQQIKFILRAAPEGQQSERKQTIYRWVEAKPTR